ncbi:amidase family protein [Spongiimicrobium salis]|uniref:amidase family protein n=1 Tax=Spongiimicrobium salis TaxID=1667022 RepID=UPI00374CF2C4
MKRIVLGIMVLLAFACKEDSTKKEAVILWEAYDDTAEVAANQEHENGRMRYKLIQSKVLDKNEVFQPLYDEVSKMSEADYEALKPLILDQNILTIQTHILKKELTYEKLVLFFLYRIYKYELDNTTTLNTVIALNKDVLEDARALDQSMIDAPKKQRHPISGMPILLKDNINTKGMITTAGAIALQDNEVEDAFIVKQLRKSGALILGKVNLSEWAYFLCSGCPVGYSAVGGQTLNPYGRRVFESGGSSSGSGTSMAASYAVAAVGTETSGSILSPSSQNSVVGLKPTIGVMSRTGIVPISSTLDTPGPMTRNVVDNAILFDALAVIDPKDEASVHTRWAKQPYYAELKGEESLKGKRLGVFKNLLENDSIYAQTIEELESIGAEIIPFDAPQVQMNGFLSILNIDMKNDLPKYLKEHSDPTKVSITSIADAITFNAQDSLVRIPYGQALFEGIMADSTTAEGLANIKETLEANGQKYFNEALDAHKLDAILSINNYHAGFAAVAKYPALTVPMGYKANGEPISLTFIAKKFKERELLQLGHAYEQATQVRRAPKGYE